MFDDPRLALAAQEEEKVLAKWRMHGAGAGFMVRAVGQVLDQVDKADQLTKRLVAAAFKRWKGSASERENFRQLIERERDDTIKK